jgi:hypothetical protein
MRTGVSYMGHHNPKHLETDIREMSGLQLDDILLAAQENDFAHFPGKLMFTAKIAADYGIRPIAIFWGALNLFGGGQSSQFLLEHPEGFQMGVDGVHRSHGCYVNPVCVSRIEQMIDMIAELGFQGYFVDEPTPLRGCYCTSCRAAFQEWYGIDLATAPDDRVELFRQRCVVEYVRKISAYCKAKHPQLETMTCLMPSDKQMWKETSKIDDLDNLGTDMYWANSDQDVEEMTPILNELGTLCENSGKVHHEWLQCWNVRKGNERRILEQGEVLIREQPDSLYIWAWQGQIGTTESCDDPATSWQYACEILRKAKDS